MPDAMAFVAVFYAALGGGMRPDRGGHSARRDRWAALKTGYEMLPDGAAAPL